MGVKAQELNTPRTSGSASAESTFALDEGFASCQSPAMRAVRSLMSDLASADIPVLVVGETGTGKEVIARQIHRLSSRRDGFFVKMRCSALSPKDLALHSDTDGQGLDSPTKRTVLLDEISELDRACQTQLLQFLSLDDATPPRERFSVGLISTTCTDLEEEMHAGRFRSDLYYRISGVSLRIPALRQRREDIPVLVTFFLAKYAALLHRLQPMLSSRAWRILEAYSWPGNVRELESVVRKLVALGDEKMALEDLEHSLGKPVRAGFGPGSYSLKETAREASRQAERDLILTVLAQTRWNRKRAAQELQISYKALLYKLKQIGLDDPAGLEDAERAARWGGRTS